MGSGNKFSNTVQGLQTADKCIGICDVLGEDVVVPVGERDGAKRTPVFRRILLGRDVVSSGRNVSIVTNSCTCLLKHTFKSYKVLIKFFHPDMFRILQRSIREPSSDPC